MRQRFWGAAFVLLVPLLMLGPCGGEDEETSTEGAKVHVEVTPVLPAKPGDRFVDVTEEAGIDFVHVLLDHHLTNIVEAQGSGAAFLDYDNDGLLDIYFVQYGWVKDVVDTEPPARVPTNKLYRNVDGKTFVDVTEKAGVGDTGFGFTAVASDYDGDGNTDIYVCNFGPNVLYRNKGDGTFEDVTARAKVDDPRFSMGGVFFDYDGDSNLDLYVINYLVFDPEYDLYYTPDGHPPPMAYEPQPDTLFRNKGDGTFEDVSEKSGIRRGLERGMTVISADVDQDGLADIFVANDATANFLWHNTGKGTFEDTAAKHGVAFGEKGETAASMTADWGDYDRDGYTDMMVTDTAYGSLYHNLGGGLFTDEVVGTGIAALCGQYVSWGGRFLDFDNDSYLDLLIVNGDMHHLLPWEDLLLRNDKGEKFEDAADLSVYFRQKLMGRGGTAADYDNDGDLDILITNLHDRPVLLRNDYPKDNAWISVALQGKGKNRQAYGAKVFVKVGDRKLFEEMRCPTAYLCSGDPRLFFGLGKHSGTVEIEVVWPGGAKQVVKDVKVNQHFVIRESQR